MSNELKAMSSKSLTRCSLLSTHYLKSEVTVTQNLVSDLFAILGKQGVFSDTKSLEVFSKDAYYYSPILKAELGTKLADVIAAPQSVHELREVVQYAFKHNIPITPRGAGTGNYGQAVPLEKGIVLSTHRMNKILNINKDTGVAHVQAGVRMGMLERQGRASGSLSHPLGFELKCYPSTWATATMGGFIGGGFGGVGSIRHGVIWDNYLTSVTVMEMTPEAKTYKLLGTDLFGFIHAYGMSGIIAELEVNLAPAVNWEESVLSFPTLENALRFGYEIAKDHSIDKRLICINEWPIPTFFKPLVNANAVKEKRVGVLLELGEQQTSTVAKKAEAFSGTLDYQVEASKYHKSSFNLSDFSWNHTTLWAMKTDPAWTYLQSRFETEPDKALAQVKTLRDYHGDKVAFHFEYLKQNGALALAALDLIYLQDEQSIVAAMDEREAIGVQVANPHSYYLDADPRWGGEPVLAAKEKYNPNDLLNPGKLSGKSLVQARSWQ
jgi:FAD/FMN-containing dehydrogenase